jgi:hypothetical protein
MARLRTVTVTAGVPTSGSGDVPTLDNFISEAPVGATFAIANAAYTSGDCVSTMQTFTSLGQSGKLLMICGATLSIDNTTAIASNFRLHMFNAAKATPLADNDPHTVLSADLTKYLGYFDLGTPVDVGTICWISQNGLAIPVLLSSADLLCQLEITTGLTPAASNLKVTLFTYPLN